MKHSSRAGTPEHSCEVAFSSSGMFQEYPSPLVCVRLHGWRKLSREHG